MQNEPFTWPEHGSIAEPLLIAGVSAALLCSAAVVGVMLALFALGMVQIP
jgi:hypothetical protein